MKYEFLLNLVYYNLKCFKFALPYTINKIESKTNHNNKKRRMIKVPQDAVAERSAAKWVARLRGRLKGKGLRGQCA